MDADTAAEAFGDTWEALLGSSPGWWVERHHGLLGGSTGIGLPSFNGAWAYGRNPDPGALDAMLDRVAATDLPYCLQARPEAEVAGEVASRRGMIPGVEIPLMVLEETGSLPDLAPPGLTVRELSAADQDAHVTVAAAGFGIAVEHFRQLMTPELSRLRGWRAYVGEVGGDPVATGGGFTHGDQVGVFNIATPPSHRRRGYGAALTARAVRDGVRDGANWAWLQATSDGLPVYERLGFKTVECWRFWIAPGGGPAA
jgi:N-acetylglutamate synthase